MDILETATNAFDDLVKKNLVKTGGDRDRAAELSCEQMVNDFGIHADLVLTVVEEWERVS